MNLKWNQEKEWERDREREGERERERESARVRECESARKKERTRGGGKSVFLGNIRLTLIFLNSFYCLLCSAPFRRPDIP